ncbi:MAG: CHASE2 domain-containing protein [Hyphomicrobium sp.]
MRLSRLQSLLTAALLVLAVVLRIADPAPVARLRMSIFDHYIDLAPRVPDPAYPVRIVDIDEASLERIGQWPWPRTRLAELVDKLKSAGAKVIALDLILAEPDRLSPEAFAREFATSPELARLAEQASALPSNDTRLAQSIAAAPVVLGFAAEKNADARPPKSSASFAFAGDNPALFAPDFPGAVASLPILAERAAGLGVVNWLPERDQIVRRVPLVFSIGGALYSSLSLEALRVGAGASTVMVKASGGSGVSAFGQETGIELIRTGDTVLPTDSSGQLWLKFTRSDPRRYLPAHRVLDGSFDPAEVGGRHVFVGASAAGLLDLRATPLDAAVPGVEIHAQAVEQMLAGEHLSRPAYATGAELMFLVGSGLVLVWLIRRAGPVRAALIGLASIVAVGWLSWLAYAGGGLLFDPVYPSIALVGLYLSTSLVTYIGTETERARVRSAFGHYIPAAIVDGIVQDPEKLRLGGESREITVLFADVRGFSRISEGMTPEELIDFVIKLFSPLTDIIYEEGGTVDKYMGDAVMAFWNAPLDVPDHATRAAHAALRMQAALKGINEVIAADAIQRGAKPAEAKLGIGLNTGECVVGNVGSSQKKNYSILGDVVNIAARLEESTKTYGMPIIMGERTAASLGELAMIEIDRVAPRGKDRLETLFALIGDESAAREPGFEKLSTTFAALAPAVAAKDTAKAATLIEGVRALGNPRFDGLCAALEKRVRS